MKINQLLISFFCMQHMSSNFLLAQQSQIPSNQPLQNTSDDSVSTGTQQLLHVINSGNVNDYQMNEAEQKALKADENGREIVNEISVENTNPAHRRTEEESKKLSSMEQWEILSQNIRRDDGSSATLVTNNNSKKIYLPLADNILAHCPEVIETLILRLKDEKKKTDGSFIKKLLLVGPPGTGKSSLGKAIAAECNMPVFTYNTAAIGNSFARSVVVELKRIFQEAIDLDQPCIIIFDELGALLRAHNNRNETDATALYYLYDCLDELENYPILFIATLNDAKELPDALKSRFKNCVVTVPLPDEQLRCELLTYYLQKTKKICALNKFELKYLTKRTEGFAHREIENLIKSADFNFSNNNTITMQDINRALHTIDLSDAAMNELWYKKLLKMGLQSAAALGFVSLLPWGYSQYQARLMHKESLHFQQQAHETSLVQQRQMHAESIKLQNDINNKSIDIRAGEQKVSILFQLGQLTLSGISTYFTYQNWKNGNLPNQTRYNP